MSHEVNAVPLRPQAITQNPKRVPAEVSVSLRRSHSPPPRSDEEKDEEDKSSTKFSAGLSAASNLAVPSEIFQNGASGLLPPNVNADAWFDDSNKNPLGKGNVRFIDQDSPFYLPRGKSSQETDTNKKSSPEGQNSGDSAPTYQYASESWSDDYRSIIDDLTVENKQLKQTLKKYEQMYSSRMQDNKLFEVYIHALAPQKKRQLEAMLREFASGVGPYDNLNQIAAQANVAKAAPVTLKRAGSSSQSTSRPVDSAYASMSASGAGASTTMSHSNRDWTARPPQSRRSTDQRVRSYVRDLPTSLLPKDNLVISEEDKKRLVVQRLEQLFVGKGDGSNAQSQQQQQQQEVSQSAAHAERRANEAKGHRNNREGHREAKISRSKKRSKPSLLASTSTSESTSSTSTSSNNGSGTEQRPTRPLDLDPAHTQDPTETIRYIKHLGFDSPRMESSRSPEPTKGWVFLNLLMNMAQLHTLNVTPDFVRQALSDLSVNFELSEDGHSVRWKGGSELTKLPSDGTSGQEDSSEISPALFQNTPEQGRATIKSSATSAQTPGRPARSRNTKAGGWRLQSESGDGRYYSPMFYHGDDSDSFNDMSSSLPLNDPGQKSRTVSSDSNIPGSERASRGSVAPPKDNGTMIFYTAAKFYTDLSSDPFCMPSIISYNRFHEQAMGTLPSPSRLHDLKGPLAAAGASLGSTHSSVDSDVEMSDGSEIKGLEDFAPSQIDTGEKNTIPLEVTGLHGISPMDNFMVDVRTNHTKNGLSKFTARTTELNPSPLPEPTYGTYFTSSSSDDEESDSEDGEDMDEFASADILRSGIDVSTYQPPTFRNVYSSNSTRQTMSSEEDSSIDMLEYARQADPDVVARHEREFEANRGPEHVDPAPATAGSVAATVGDISNFLTSQEDGASVDGRVRPHSSVSKMAGLKRSIRQADTGFVASPSKRQDITM